MERALANRSLTARSIARLVPSVTKLGRLACGSFKIVAGQSHSCERATSRSSQPSAQTISVADAMSETTRTSGPQPALEETPERPGPEQRAHVRPFAPRLLGEDDGGELPAIRRGPAREVGNQRDDRNQPALNPHAERARDPRRKRLQHAAASAAVALLDESRHREPDARYRDVAESLDRGSVQA